MFWGLCKNTSKIFFAKREHVLFDIRVHQSSTMYNQKLLSVRRLRLISVLLQDDSPDWSSLSPVLRSFKEEADQSPEAHRDGLMVKRSTFSERDFQTSNSFQSATQHNASRRAQRNEDYSHRSRDRFKSCYAMPERALSSRRHGRRPPPGDMNRFATSSQVYASG